MSGENSEFRGWFEDRHLQEVLQLLRGPIFERVKHKRQEISKNMTKSEIATGPTVRIGYVFRPKPEYQMCLLPTSQPIYTSDSEDEEQHHRYQYRNLGLHHEKLVVYTCLVKESSSHSSMAQILSAIGENSPQPKSVSISSYFNRVIPPGSSQSSQASASTTDTDKTQPQPHTEKSTKLTGRATDPRKRKLKCIIKRSGPKLSKKVKKMKQSSDSVATVTSSSSSSIKNVNQINEQDSADDEFSRLSFYGDLPTEDSDSKQEKGEVCDGKMILVSMDTFKKCKMKDSKEVKVTDCELLNESRNPDLFENQAEERDDINDMSDEVNFIEENSGKKSHNFGNKSTKLSPVSVAKDDGNNSDSSELTLYMVESPTPTLKDAHANVDVEKETLGNDLNLEEKNIQSDLNVESVSSSLSVENEPCGGTGVEEVTSAVSNQFIDTSYKNLIPVTNLLSSPSPNTSKCESKSDESNNSRSEKIASDSSQTVTRHDNPVSSDCKESSRRETQSNDELPTIKLKKRDRSWRKSLAIMMNENPETTKPEIEVIDCEKIDCDLMEDLAKLHKHKMCLTSKFRKELEGISHESQLTESQIEQMVLGSKEYLFSIFMGKHISRRHADYKRGGTARFNLNYQVNLGMFTETQQDAVMDTLMTIFCKRHHKYMDYILKVLLPEMMIWILMEVKHTSYEETETLMSGYIM